MPESATLDKVDSLASAQQTLPEDTRPRPVDELSRRFAGPRAELLILGTFHFRDAGLDSYRPQHVVDMMSPTRQQQIRDVVTALAKYGPTKIALEVPKAKQVALDAAYQDDQSDEQDLSPNEIYQLGFRLARQLNHPRVFAVDAQGRRYTPSVDTEQAARTWGQERLLETEYYERYEQLYAWEDELKTRLSLRDYLLYLNAEERIRLGHGHYLVGEFKVSRGDDYPGADHVAGWWYARNLRIFANVAAIAEPDDRVLLIIGAGHTSIISHAADASPEFELVDLGSVL